jgi:hypothetical protein
MRCIDTSALKRRMTFANELMMLLRISKLPRDWHAKRERLIEPSIKKLDPIFLKMIGWEN